MVKELQTWQGQLAFLVLNVAKRQLQDANTVGKKHRNTLALVVLRVQIKMAEVIITFKLMPKAPEVDLSKVEEAAKVKISEFGGEVGKVLVEPVAFGLKSLSLIFVMDESKGSTDFIEDNMRNVDGVQSVEVTDVRRAIG